MLANEYALITLAAGLPALAGAIAADVIKRRQRQQLRRELEGNRQLLLLPAPSKESEAR